VLGKVEILFQTPDGYSSHTSALTAPIQEALVEGKFHWRLTKPGGETEAVAVKKVLQKVSELVKLEVPPTISSVEMYTQTELAVALIFE